MTVKEKVAYLKGLAAGMSIETDEKGEFFAAIINTFDTIADAMEELGENALDLGEEIDAISDDLAEVEDFILGDEFDIDDDDFDFDDFDDDEYDEDDSPVGCDFCGAVDDEEVSFTIDVNCPECNAEIELDEVDIANESVTCPACRKLIELEIDEVD